MFTQASTIVRGLVAARKVMLGAVAACAIGVAGMIPQQAHAAGFPTVDIAALIQRITSYLTQLQGYSDQLTATTLESSQLAQLITDYGQTLTEYSDFLQQVRSLRAFISAGEYDLLLAAIEPYYGNSQLADIVDLDYRSPTFEQDVLDILRDTNGVLPKTASELDVLLTRAGIDRPDAAQVVRKNNAKYAKKLQREIDRNAIIARNADSSKQRKGELDTMRVKLDGLGDKSELGTLQFISLQLIKLLQYNDQQMEIQNQQLALTELASTQEAVVGAKIEQARLNQLAKAEAELNKPKADTYTNGF
jgi:hypothetical protein